MALYSNTLAVIRQYLSSAVGDLIMGTPDSGTSTTIVDTMLRKADDYYNEKDFECYIYAGTNIGEAREVEDWEKEINTLTLDPAFTAAIQATSLYELHCIFTESDYRKAINLAIEKSAGKYLIDIKDETTITLAADTYEYELPLSMLYLYQVITEDAVGSDNFYNSGIINSRYYSIIKSYPPKLKLDKTYYSVAAGKELRLEGQGTQAIVDDDTDAIYLPPGWLVEAAITFLPMHKIIANNLADRYKAAVAMAEKIPMVWPNPKAKRVVE